MNAKEWDADIEASIALEKIRKKTVLELIEEYWNQRRREVYKEVKEEIEKNE